MKKKTGVILAMDKELALLLPQLSDVNEVTINGFKYFEGTLDGSPLVLHQCGIGKVNAAVGCTQLIRDFAPARVVSTGVAGGIDKCLEVLGVVVGKEVVYHDVYCGEPNEPGQIQGMPARFAADPAMLAAAHAAGGASEGLICTGDQFITDKDQLAAIKKLFPEGLACDMESGAIAQTCHILGTPFISVRVISDIPGVENHFATYYDFWDRVATSSFDFVRKFLASLD